MTFRRVYLAQGEDDAALARHLSSAFAQSLPYFLPSLSPFPLLPPINPFASYSISGRDVYMTHPFAVSKAKYTPIIQFKIYGLHSTLSSGSLVIYIDLVI